MHEVKGTTQENIRSKSSRDVLNSCISEIVRRECFVLSEVQSQPKLKLARKEDALTALSMLFESGKTSASQATSENADSMRRLCYRSWSSPSFQSD
jgi:hypothetical protein